ncbi:YqeG family HAD IIIA-type phosphatase [Prochlorococcus marinus]|uniref:YqeG family HAD IIIA-type phosphatase n=1 Tax=Prochlorococcus marinus TaxID=1219 RepID=UPI0022B5DCA2|nr:YqeG family HAD IIIA-type phosphatase [Prochlorococcus marinus]
MLINTEVLKAKWNTGKDIRKISYNEIKDKGIKLLLLDVDGTLLPRNEIKVHHSVYQWIQEAKRNFKIHLISNNPSKRRIQSIAKQLNVTFTYKAIKPRKKAIVKSIQPFNFYNKEIAIIGDRIFTDILVGNRLGIYTILVKPIDSNGNVIQDNKMQIIENKVASIIGAYK